MKQVYRASFPVLLCIVASAFVIVPASHGRAQEKSVRTTSPFGWSQVADDLGMANRGMRAVYDSDRKVVVMFGGWPAGAPNPTNLTWEFDGAAWKQINPAASPPALISPANNSTLPGTTVTFK